MARASDAPLLRGNQAELLVDGTQAFPRWIAEIESAERWIHLENYILRDDRTGRMFRTLLCDKAREGVRVRVLYDWLGCWATPPSFWKPFRAAGVEVRAFAPPRLRTPLAVFRRDHRKSLVVDGRYASVAGLCIGDEWAGDPLRGQLPWRDTAVEFRGPAVAAVNEAFAQTWALAGPPLPPEERVRPDQVPVAGPVGVRVIAGEPGRSRVYRLTQLVTVGVARRLWITDPYFVAPPAMVEALAAAARDGVDVRIIVPAFNNWPIVGGMSRAGYRPLLEAGVRLFEWEGPMIHAKTAVADGMWSRIGSSNLNLASLLANWELDVVVVDPDFGAAMEALFLEDLRSCVEITLRRQAGSQRFAERLPVAADGASLERARWRRRHSSRGSRLGRMVGRLSRAGSVLLRALLGHRDVTAEDRGWIAALGGLLVLLAGLGFLVPGLLAYPLAFLLFWFGLASLVWAWRGPREPATSTGDLAQARNPHAHPSSRSGPAATDAERADAEARR